MKVLSFKKGEIIFKQYDFQDCMYEILSGSVGIYTAYGTEAEEKVNVLRCGESVGEMGLIDTFPRSATAVALEDGTELREIGREEFAEYFKTQPERLLQIMRQLSERLRDRTADYEGACVVLNALKATKNEKEKRSRTLLERTKELIAFYDRIMAETASNPDLYLGTSYPYYTHRM